MSLIGAMLEARSERRATVQTVGTLERPTEALVASLGGGPTRSGVPVSERSAQGIPVVFACDKVIREDVAKTPIKIKRVLEDRTRADDPNHPAFYTFHEMANPAMTAFEFQEQMQGHLNLWGNAYAEIIRKRHTIELWPIEPWRVWPELDSLNRLTYSVQMASGRPKTYIFDPAAPPIFHLRQNCSPWYRGRGPVQVLRETMGIAMAQERYEGRFYGQGGHPRVALSTSQGLTDTSARRIRQDFETLTVGEHNWHRVVVLDHDLKPVPLVMPNRDVQFLELKKLGRDELCGAFRVAAHKVQNLERSTNNNIEHQAIEHVGDCLMPHFVRWQQAIRRDILSPISIGTHFATFKIDALMRGDFKSMNDALQLQRQNGVISANQWLRLLDSDDQIPASEGGDLYLVNGNMMPMRRDPAAVVDFDVPPNRGVN